MKRTILFISSLVVIVGCSKEPINYENTLSERNAVFYTNDTNNPYSGKVFSVYDDGNKKGEGTLKDGKMISKTEWKWYKNGQKWSEGTFRDGKVDGLFKWWYENGQKKKEVTFKDGREDGLMTSWYDNGNKSSKRTYKDGEFDGLETYWHINGKKYRETTYTDGKLIFEKEWNKDGSVKK